MKNVEDEMTTLSVKIPTSILIYNIKKMNRLKNTDEAVMLLIESYKNNGGKIK